MIAKANPIEEYNQSPLSLDEQWQSKINNHIKDYSRRPHNAMNNVSMGQANVVYPYFGTNVAGAFYNPAVLPNLINSFNLFGARYNKISQVTAYNMAVDIVVVNADTIPSDALNYNIPIYFTFFAESVVAGQQELMMSYPVGTLNWDGSIFSWIGTPRLNSTFNLIDNLLYRDLFLENPDFRDTNLFNQNDKITLSQYNKLINNTSTLIAPSIVADNSLLTLAESTHFETIMNNQGYMWHLSMNFNMFGFLANYQL